MLGALLLFALTLAPMAVGAQGLDALSITTQGDGSQTYTLTLQVLLLMTALSVLPAILLAMTSFTRIIIVLAILRQALGTAQTPSNQILVALALFMTFFIMSPVADKVYVEAVQPYLDDKLDANTALALRRGAGARLHVRTDPRIGYHTLHRDVRPRRLQGQGRRAVHHPRAVLHHQ